MSHAPQARPCSALRTCPRLSAKQSASLSSQELWTLLHELTALTLVLQICVIVQAQKGQ